MLLVPRLFDAHIVYYRIREWCNVIKLSRTCNSLRVAKANTKCAPSTRENKGRTFYCSSFLTPDEAKVARLGCGLLLSGQDLPLFFSPVLSAGNLNSVNFGVENANQSEFPPGLSHLSHCRRAVLSNEHWLLFLIRLEVIRIDTCLKRNTVFCSDY